MNLTSLELRHFRNRKTLRFEPAPGVNLILGANGSGKTNLIEAVAVLTTGVSPRGAETESMVEWEEDGFCLKGVFANDEPGVDPVTLEMKYRRGEARRILVNGKAVPRLRDLIGTVPVVSFVPEDLALVRGEPEIRRRAVNMVLAQIDPVYADDLRRYSEALRSRNAALRQLAEGQISQEALEPWDEAVIKNGVPLCRRRAAFASAYSPRLAEIQKRISTGREAVQLDYKPSFAGPWDASAATRWQGALRALRAQEIALGATLTGPQRDDFLFIIDDRPAKAFASEGQMRTMAVSFKLAEISTLQEEKGQRPLCLLDDVLSELDAERADHLLDELTGTGQCFVTLTGLESWPHHKDLPAARYRLDKAGLKRNTELSGVTPA